MRKFLKGLFGDRQTAKFSVKEGSVTSIELPVTERGQITISGVRVGDRFIDIYGHEYIHMKGPDGYNNT